MFEIKDKVDDIVENIEEIAKTYYRLTVVKAAGTGSNVGASLLIMMLLFSLLLFAMFFVFMGLSWWIGQKLENQVLGFLIVAGGLFLLLLIVILLSKKVIFPFIRNIIIKKIYG